MKSKGIKYCFSGIPWQHRSPGGWHFVSLPHELSSEIRINFQSEEEGWGRLKVLAKVGNTEWQTAIWFDRKTKDYSLPLKTEIRKKEGVALGKMTDVTLWI